MPGTFATCLGVQAGEFSSGASRFKDEIRVDLTLLDEVGGVLSGVVSKATKLLSRLEELEGDDRSASSKDLDWEILDCLRTQDAQKS